MSNQADLAFDGLRFEACPCGMVEPCAGWMAPPLTYYLHCPGCGHWEEGNRAELVAANWNNRARAMRLATVAAFQPVQLLGGAA